jgi:hypothetical protein
MYQGRQAAPVQAAGDHYGSRQPTATTPPSTGRRRRTGLAPVPESARAAREFTVTTLRKWRLEPLIEDAVVIASELATNAIRHGTPAAMRDAASGSGGGPRGREEQGGRIELSWCLQASRLICVVTDQTGTPPALVSGGPEAESGHGLQIVGALAVAWGWTILATGEKAVWAALELPGQAGAAVKGDREAGGAPAGAIRATSPAAVHDMRVAGRAADQDHRDPSPATPLSRAAG